MKLQDVFDEIHDLKLDVGIEKEKIRERMFWTAVFLVCVICIASFLIIGGISQYVDERFYQAGFLCKEKEIKVPLITYRFDGDRGAMFGYGAFSSFQYYNFEYIYARYDELVECENGETTRESSYNGYYKILVKYTTEKDKCVIYRKETKCVFYGEKND